MVTLKFGKQVFGGNAGSNPSWGIIRVGGGGGKMERYPFKVVKVTYTFKVLRVANFFKVGGGSPLDMSIPTNSSELGEEGGLRQKPSIPKNLSELGKR